jgi:pyridoxamine 5'-phosphate oxidase
MPNRDLHKMRESYETSSLLEEDCDKSPFLQFEKWFHHALEDKLYEPNAMSVSTCNKNGQPSSRMVLLKSFDENGFVFYTNYKSRKGNDIHQNSKVALLFWWAQHERQVRIEGIASTTNRDLNDIYFHSRPRGSQIAATISDQSKVIANREVLDKLYSEKEKEFEGKDIPMKEHWGGYVIVPHLFEFWQGRKSRLHDRIQYTKEGDGLWKAERLAP